jgi:hypothetical protein
MAWTAPMTAVSGSVFTASQFNTFIRDNLSETAPAKATTVGSYFVTSATNQIVERIPSNDLIATSQTTSSTSYTDLATVGPTITVTTSTCALIAIYTSIGSDTAGSTAWMSFDVSGATTLAANDNRAISHRPGSVAATTDMRAGALFYLNTLTAGSNVFTAKYRVSGVMTGTYSNRRILVIPM